MKQHYIIFLLFVLCPAIYAQDSIRISLAEWTFDSWYGGGILPPGLAVNKPVPADRGTLATTAQIGTEQMFQSGTVSRVWNVATTGGYVRCSTGWSGSAERYYMMSGVNTLNASSVSLTSSHATSSSSQVYSLKVQYRLSSSGPWKDLYGPFQVTDVTESGIGRKQVNNVKLPGECNNKSYLDIRWLCTTFPSSSSTQFRLDNIYLKANIKNPDPDADKTALIQAQALNEDDWAVPSWTLLLSARKKATDAPVTENMVALQATMNSMLPKEAPYAINTSFNGDPCTNMGFAWYTNAGTTEGKVQLIEKTNATVEDFYTPQMILDASATTLNNVNYLVASNDPTSTADLPVNTKRSYVVHKALATGLNPNKVYSYRVGKDGAWSSIRNFQTAKNNKDDFSFIYITDTQANSNDNFDCSAEALREAFRMADNPLFALVMGDLVETQGSSNSEWEYEQFFEKMQDVWSKLPIVSTIGNHDNSSNFNFFHHINNDISYNKTATVKSSMDGTVYSFVVGNALFMVVNHEDASKSGYLTSLGNWMTEQVNAHPEVLWRIVCVHSGLFSGGSHQGNSEYAAIRNAMLPYYHSLKIDLSIQGHDHVYNAIGPVDNLTKTVVPGSVQNVRNAPVVVQSNMNGKSGGTFDVSSGTFYFINNSASRKKYSPTTQSSMNSSSSTTGVPNYWSLFTGRFGQTGEPTFSNIKVTTDTIFISTYAINNITGNTYLFDQIKITKQKPTSVNNVINNELKISFEQDNHQIKVSGMDVQHIHLYDLRGSLVAKNNYSNKLSVSNISDGIYLVRVFGKDGIVNKKILI
ncbi:MAG: fibronectin type III domain-containing protein [Paludibacter sp.]|nr:fibronectin type III domain-containing protein [Paludibacter sp.]